MEKNSVNARERHVKETKDYSVEEFVRKISEAIKSRK
jgi:threonyl-tRNA synthetase